MLDISNYMIRGNQIRQLLSKEMRSKVDLTFSDHACGACFKP